MKATFFAAAAAMAGAASAANHRHAHQKFANRDLAANTTASMCVPGCTTIWKTITGEATLVPPKVTTVTSTWTNTSTVTVHPTPTSASTTVETTTVVVVPTPIVQKCPTPGTYTFPATTMTVTDTTTVCGATTTSLPSGTHTVGGVTTVVTTETTVTCPVATVKTIGTVTTSTIVMTEYYCPVAGTYTIGPHTTSCSTDSVVVYPTPTVIVPGTYTKPEVVVTATETDYVTVCPFSKSGVPTTTATPVSTPAVTSSATPVVSKTSSVAPSSTPSTSTTTGGSGSGNSKTSIVGTNDHYGITYTPYNSDTGACKSADQVAIDIAAIKRAGFQAVRIYGTDCDTLQNVVPNCVKQGLEVIAGIFVKAGGQCSITNPQVKQQVDELNAMGSWASVRLLVVGNESIENNICTATELAQLLKDVKSECSGYTGPVTIAETLNIWQQTDVSSSLCHLVDIVGSNIHAFFNAGCAASDAGSFVKGQIQILEKICGKNVINLETGWKNAGSCNGLACPSPSDQKEAISSIRSSCGDQSVFFSFEDDLWKPAGDQDWGLQAIFNFGLNL